MSAKGQKQTFRAAQAMSALPPKTDIRQHDWDRAKSRHFIAFDGLRGLVLRGCGRRA
jgi:hypothetical protein